MDMSFLPPLEGRSGLSENNENSENDQGGRVTAFSSQNGSLIPIMSQPRFSLSYPDDSMNGVRGFDSQQGSFQGALASEAYGTPSHINGFRNDHFHDHQMSFFDQGSFEGIPNPRGQHPPTHNGLSEHEYLGNENAYDWEDGLWDEPTPAPDVQGPPHLIRGLEHRSMERLGIYDPQQEFLGGEPFSGAQDPQAHLHNANIGGPSMYISRQDSLEDLISGRETQGPSSYIDGPGSDRPYRYSFDGLEQKYLDEPQKEVSEQDDHIDHSVIGSGQDFFAHDAENAIAHEAEELIYKIKPLGEVFEDTQGNAVSWRPCEENDELVWQEATYLTKEVRREIIEEMSRLGRYKHPRPIGPGEANETSFHPDQKDWGFDRKDRPDILFQYNNLEASRKRKRDPYHVMRHKGKLMIDIDSGKPLRDHPNIPKCLSSVEEGWLLEALSRQDPGIEHEDLWDRMPYWCRPNETDIGMRRSRFRWEAACKSWVIGSATDKTNAYLDDLVPQHFQTINSTRGWRDLHHHELLELEALNQRIFPNPARKMNKAKKTAVGKGKGKELPSTPTSRPSDWVARLLAEEIDHDHPDLDFRDKVPETNVQRRVIQRALAPTRDSITRVLGELTPPTDENASYNAQWDALVNHYVSSPAWVGSEPQSIPRFQDPWLNAFPIDLYYDLFDLPETFGDQI